MKFHLYIRGKRVVIAQVASSARTGPSSTAFLIEQCTLALALAFQLVCTKTALPLGGVGTKKRSRATQRADSGPRKPGAKG